MRRRQQGLHTTEFALVGMLFFVLLFGVIEFGRALFVWNALTEATRRGAQRAAICPVNHPSIAKITIFNAPAATSTDSPVVSGLSASNVTVDYLNQAGTVLLDPSGSYSAIRSVRVSLTGYHLPLMIPFFNLDLPAPPFATTVPRESLGAGPAASCAL